MPDIIAYTQRPFAVEDAPFVVQAHALPHVMSFVSGVPTQQQVIDSIGKPGMIERIIFDERMKPVGLWRARIHDGWLMDLLLVIAAVPRRGIGRFAVRSAKRHAFEQIGAHRLWLEVTAANIGARTLYESEGFVHEGTYRDGFRAPDGSFQDLVHYGLLADDRRS